MKFYAVTIRGHKFYFSGSLPSEAINRAEQFCVNLESDANYATPRKLFLNLLDYMESSLDCPVVEIKIDHVFRVNF